MKDLVLGAKKDNYSKINLGGVVCGGSDIILMGGPCAVEDPAQMRSAARIVKEAGGKVLRGGIFKPRTSPYSFQGLGETGLEYLLAAAREQDLLCITEVIDAESMALVQDKVDIIQIGARNMQNYHLLKLAGECKKPVVLKRGLAATISEWLLAAEYILAAGNPNVVLCERGIRTFETATRSTLDLSAVVVAKELTHLPVIVDPSHAAGRRDLVPALAKAAIAAGADGLLIEMHPEPEHARCDGEQSLSPEQFTVLAREISLLAASLDRIFKITDEKKEDLTSLRSQIDKIDDEIVELLAKRMGLAGKVAGQKSIDKIRDINREKDVITRLTHKAEVLNCPPDLVKQVYTMVFEHSVHLQLKSKLVQKVEHSIG